MRGLSLGWKATTDWNWLRGGLVLLGLVLGVLVFFAPEGDDHDSAAASRCAETGDDPVIEAVALGRRSNVQRLLDEGADPDGRRPDGDVPGETPLTCAVRTDRSELVALLLRRGADPDREVREEMPLAYAALRGNSEAVRLLLAADADPNHAARLGERPLTHAAGLADVDIVTQLLQAGAAPTAEALDAATNVFTGLDEDTSHRTLRAIAGLLLDAGADPDGNGRDTSPLLSAAATGDTPMVDLLLIHGADPDHGGRVPELFVEMFVELGFGGDVEPDVRDLLPPPSQDNVDNIPPLVAAVWTGHDDIVQRLLDAGADPNLAGDDAYTPILAAAARGDRTLVETLLGRGADPTPQVRSGVPTPAEIARAGGNDAIADLLGS